MRIDGGGNPNTSELSSDITRGIQGRVASTMAEVDKEFKEKLEAERQAKKDAQNVEANEAELKRKTEANKIKARLKKGLFARLLGQKIQDITIKDEIKALGQLDPNKLLQVLKENNVKNLDKDKYQKLILKLKSLGLDKIGRILEKEGTGRELETDDEISDENATDFLAKIANEKHSMVDALADQPMNILDSRLTNIGIEIKKLEETGENRTLTIEEELYLASLEYDEKALSKAIIKRHFNNYRMLDLYRKGKDNNPQINILRNKLIRGDNTEEEKQEITELINLIKELGEESDTVRIESTEDSRVNLKAKLERARLLIDKHGEKEEEKSEQDKKIQELLEQRTEADKQKKLRETVGLMPRGELSKLREKAGKGDEIALENYILQLKANTIRDFINSKIYHGEDTNEEINSQDYYKRINELIKKDQLSEEEKLELYSLTSTLALEMDSMDLENRLQEASNENQKQQFISQIPKSHKIRLLQNFNINLPLGKDKWEDIDDLAIDSLLNENFEKIKAGFTEMRKETFNREITEFDQNYADALLSAHEISNLDVDQYISQASDDVKIHTARVLLYQDFIREGRIDMGMIREKFNMVGLSGLDIYTKEGEEKFLQYIQGKTKDPELKDALEKLMVNRGNFYKDPQTMYDIFLAGSENFESSPDKLKDLIKAINTARTEGPEALQKLKVEKELIDLVEEGLTYPFDYIGKDANAEAKFSEPARKLFEELMKLKQQQQDLEKHWESYSIEENGKREATEELQNYMFANTIFNNLLNKIGASSVNEEIINAAKAGLSKLNFKTDAKTFTESLKNAVQEINNIDGAAKGDVVKRLEEIIKTFSDEKQGLGKNWKEVFTIEKGAGGYFMRIYSKELMHWFAGLDSKGYGNLYKGVEGITLQQNNLLEFPGQQPEQKKIPGYLAIINSQSAAHEKLHIIEKSIHESLGSSEGQSAEEQLPYFKYGIDEIVANLMGKNYLEVIPKMQGLDSMNLTLNLTQEEIAELKNNPDKLKEIITKDPQRKKAYVILELVKDLIKVADEKDKAEASESIISILTENGNDLDNITYALFRAFPYNGLAGMDIGQRQTLLLALNKKYPEQGDLIREKLNDILGNYYTSDKENRQKWLEQFDTKKTDAESFNPENIEAIEPVINIFTGQTYDPQSIEEFIKAQQQLARTNEIFKFFRYVDASGGLAENKLADVPDALPFTDVWGNFRGKFGRELKRDLNTIDTLPWKNVDSYFSERTVMRVLPLPLLNKTMPGKVIEGFVNGFIDKALIRTMYPLNTRDFRSAWAGTPLGNYLGISKFRGSSPAGRRGYIHPMAFIWGKTHEEWFKANKKGINERGRYQGFVTPDYIDRLSINDKHFAILNVIQDVLSKDISGSQTFGLLEKISMATVNSIPNDRPSVNPSVNEKKAGEISDLALQRMLMQSMNFNASTADQVGANDYGRPFEFGVGKWAGDRVVVDENGTMWVNTSGGFKPIGEDTITAEFGKKYMENNDKFYKEWQPDIVIHAGREWYVHVDPSDGMPKLYKEKWIDWGKTKPTPAMDPLTKMAIQPRQCEYKQKRDNKSNRHRMDMNIGSIGLFRRIMKLREEQKQAIEAAGKTWKEEDLYSFQDLIRSIEQYRDPTAGPADDFFVKDIEATVFNGVEEKKDSIRQIFLPPVKEGEEPVAVDFEIAMELIARMEKFELRDNVLRKAWVKGNAENIMYEEMIPEYAKIRQTFGRYIQMMMYKDMDEYSTVIKDKPTPPNEVTRYTVAQISGPLSGLTGDMPKYIKTPEGTAKRLEYLMSIDRPDGSPEEAEYNELKARMDRFAEFDEYEKMLYYGQYSMFKDKTQEERRQIREQVKQYINSTIDSTYLADIQADLVSKGELKVDGSGNLLQGEDVKLWEFLLHDDLKATGGMGGGVTEATLGAFIIDKFFLNTQDRRNYNALTDLKVGKLDPAYTKVKTEAKTNTDTQLNAPFDDLYNKGYFDKRPFERFLDDKDDQKLKDIAKDLMSNIQDRDKYRQEMKDWTLKIMQLADFHANEFNRYRRAKYFWEAMSKNLHRYNNIIFMGALAGMAFMGSPIFFSIVLANIGMAKTLLPYTDMKLAVSVNRRNYARELARKIRAESNHIIEMFEKGGTLHDNLRSDLQDLELEYGILGESIQGKFKPEGWHANKNFIIDDLVNSLMGEQGGLIPGALAA